MMSKTSLTRPREPAIVGKKLFGLGIVGVSSARRPCQRAQLTVSTLGDIVYLAPLFVLLVFGGMALFLNSLLIYLIMAWILENKHYFKFYVIVFKTILLRGFYF